MREFGLSIDQVLVMQPRRFWFLSNQIDKLRAEEGYQQLQILAAVSDAETFKLASENLKERMGQIFVWDEPIPSEFAVDPETGLDPEFDREGLQALRQKMLGGL